MAAVNRNRSARGVQGVQRGQVLEVAAIPSEGSMSKRQTRQMVNKLSEKGKKQVKKEGERGRRGAKQISHCGQFFQTFIPLSYSLPFLSGGHNDWWRSRFTWCDLSAAIRERKKSVAGNCTIYISAFFAAPLPPLSPLPPSPYPPLFTGNLNMIFVAGKWNHGQPDDYLSL